MMEEFVKLSDVKASMTKWFWASKDARACFAEIKSKATPTPASPIPPAVSSQSGGQTGEDNA